MSETPVLPVPATLVRRDAYCNIYKVGSQSDAGKLWNWLKRRGLQAQYKKGLSSTSWYVRVW